MTGLHSLLGKHHHFATSALAGAIGIFLPAAAAHAETTPPVGGAEASAPAPTTARTNATVAQASVIGAAATAPTADDQSIRPFRIHVPDEAIADMRRRIAATRWPDKETVDDRTQGVQLAKLQPLAEYWATDYDWRKAEATLNALPQFVTTIDGLDIQFAHIKSKYPNALPLILTHGWPGSVIELLKVIGPLTDPPAYGGKAEDAFDLVIPSIPGYGFSGKPTGTGWGPAHFARAWDGLMHRLGYGRYVAQGGDWGAIISEVMAVQAPPGLAGIHINMPGTTPPDVISLIRNREPAPANFSPEEKRAYDRLAYFYDKGFGYADMMNTRPQTLGYALADSPVGMLAFNYDKFAEWSQSGGDPESVFTRDEILDAVSLYWLTNTGTSSSRSYWEAAQVAGGGPFNAVDIQNVPVAVTVFPGEISPAPKSWAEKTFHKLIYFNEVDKGGHFAAWEQPALFVQELRTAFRPLR
jgi:pimeloyl-ACP methyl ester carboxylesterase